MDEKKIRAEMKAKEEEREAIIHRLARITEEEERRYNRLGMEITVLGRNFYPKKR